MEDIEISTAAELREIYLPTQAHSLYHAQDDYLQLLTEKGLILNPKVAPAVFHLRNGLPYVGMSVTQTVTGGEVLIRIPEELILSSCKAAYQDVFFLNETETWEDRVIIVYCMYLLQKGQTQHPWYQMISRFPKECDIACFWSQQELDSFQDLTIRSAAALDLQSFEQEWELFSICQQKYEVLQQPQFNKDNYRNIFINLTNRSFGKNINYVSMVPFAELFNHHCSKVYYTVEHQPKTYLKDEVPSDDESSVGSYDSNQYLEEGEFAYDSFEVTNYNWEVEQSYELVKKEKLAVQKEAERLLTVIDKELNWQDFTVLFVGHLMLKTRIIQKEYLVGRKPYQKAISELAIVDRSLNNYRQKITQFYQTTKKKQYMCKTEEKKNEPIVTYPIYKKQYESVIIKTSKFDRAEPGQQIFFRYGHNSNRSLLLRYGFAIEGNKYEHVWLSFNIVQCLQEFPDVLESVMAKKLSLLRKFKVQHHIFNLDAVLFFRLNSWTFFHESAVDEVFTVAPAAFPKELAILQQIADILEANRETYAGEWDLTDPALGYHQYFVAVYHREKLAIINKQLKLLRTAMQILSRIGEGQSKAEATSNLSKSEVHILRHYLAGILEK